MENQKCLLCGFDIQYQTGTIIDINDGITAYCGNKDCKMQDWGHGKDEKSAYEIFRQKCTKGK